jgi:hypothetical protein
MSFFGRITVAAVGALLVCYPPAVPLVEAQWRQAVPFGPIAALTGWSDLPSASGLIDDVRFSRWHGGEPSPLVRIRRDRNNVISTEALLWFGGDFTHPSRLPSGSDVLCDSRKEPPPTCIKPIPIPPTIVLPDITDLLKIESCETPMRPGVPPVAVATHTLTLQMQIVGGRAAFRTYRCAGPVTVHKGPGAALAARLLNILEELGRAAGYQ